MGFARPCAARLGRQGHYPVGPVARRCFASLDFLLSQPSAQTRLGRHNATPIQVSSGCWHSWIETLSTIRSAHRSVKPQELNTRFSGMEAWALRSKGRRSSPHLFSLLQDNDGVDRIAAEGRLSTPCRPAGRAVRRSQMGPGCVKTRMKQECAELFSLLASPDSGGQSYWFSD